MPIGKTAGLAVLLAVGLSGCHDDAVNDGAATGPVATASAPSMQDLPDCDAMPALLGGLVDGLIPVEASSSGQGKWDNGWNHGVNCTWMSPRLVNENVFESIKGGTFTVGVSIDKEPSDEAALRQMGLVFDDPRAEAVGGYVVAMDKAFNLAEPLGIVGPQVVVGRTTIVMASGGAFLQHVEELAPITNDRAIGASVDLYKALRDR